MQRIPKSYSPAERAGIMAAIRRGLEVGRRVGVTARECGITESIYYRWVREQGRGGPAETSFAGLSGVGRAQDGTALAEDNRNLADRRRGPLPTDLRDRLQLRAVALREVEGLPLNLIAERLGVSQATVARWLAKRSQEAGFVEVEVVANVPEPAPVVPVLLAPGGYRVEGLDVAGLAELLRRLA